VLDDPDLIQQGRIVFLYPQSKTASANVHRQLSVTVMKDPKAHWPMVVVGWKEDGVDRWELVHRDNIRLKRPGVTTTKADKHEGDNVREGAGMGRWAKVRKMPTQAKAKVDMPDDMEQGTLF
jgi:hypothetical protein